MSRETDDLILAEAELIVAYADARIAIAALNELAADRDRRHL